MVPKKRQSFLAQAFQGKIVNQQPIVTNVPINKTDVQKVDFSEVNDFGDDDFEFLELCETVTCLSNVSGNEIKVVPPNLNVNPTKITASSSKPINISSTGVSSNQLNYKKPSTRNFLKDAFSQSNLINNNTTQVETKKKPNNSFLAHAFSQSFNNVTNKTKIENNSNTDYDILKVDRDKLQEEIYKVSGKLILTEENQKRNLLTRDNKIKFLQDELIKIKSEDKKEIQSLKSQLQFKQANLMAANQHISELETQLIPKCNTTIEEESIPWSHKRVKLTASHPISKSNTFFTDNSFVKRNMPIIQEKVASVTTDSVEMNVEDKLMDVTINDDNAIGNTETIDTDQLPRVIRSTIPLKERNDCFDVLLIVGHNNEPIKCCLSMEHYQRSHYTTLLDNKLVEIISEDYVPLVTDKSLSKRTLDLNELKRLISSQLNQLVVSTSKRTGGLNASTIKRLISCRLFLKNKIFVNPIYCCSYRYIFPIWQTIKKLMYMMSRYPHLVSELLAECVLPPFLSVVNCFQIVFCCKTNETAKINDCMCLVNNVEMEFVIFVLECVIKVFSNSDSPNAGRIYSNLFKSLINLVPLLGARLDLRTTMVKLFTKMCSFNIEFQCSNVINEHKKGECILIIIFDLLKCDCLENADRNVFSELYTRVIDFVLTMCANGFVWNPDCECMVKLFSLLAFLGHIVLRDIFMSAWTPASLELFKRLMTTYVQMKSSISLDSYKSLTDTDEFRSLLVLAHKIIHRYLLWLTDCSISDLRLIEHYEVVLTRDV